MNSAGNLSISACYAAGRLSGLAVRLERPPVTKLFLGQTPEAVARTVPYLYTLCAQAQGTACRAAMAAARDELPTPMDSAALWAEALHEHFWRLLLDWPLALGLPQARDAFVAWRKERSGKGTGAATSALLESTLLGCPARDWRENGMRLAPHSLAARCFACLECIENTKLFHPLPLTPGAWLAYWRGERFEAPATFRPPSVAAAWRSRLQEAVEAALALDEGAPYPVASAGADGWGIGQTFTARGILTHGVKLEDGRVAAYRVWAPTDRHFADPVALAGLLDNGFWPDVEGAKRAVEQAVLALDPCLPYTVKVDNA